KVLPCSEESKRARSSYSLWISSRNLNITRARRWGLVAAQAGKAASALAIAFSTSALLASDTLAWTSPVLGLNTSPKRPDAPLTILAADEMIAFPHFRFSLAGARPPPANGALSCCFFSQRSRGPAQSGLLAPAGSLF